MAHATAVTRTTVQSLLKHLDDLEDGAGGGVITIADGSLDVSNLRKPFWPSVLRDPNARGRRKTAAGARRGVLTKGDLLRHYVRVAPFILPVLEERPLVMKRYPNGVAGAPFYQHRAPDRVPPGVDIARVTTGTETRPHLIGGTLTTLLYTAQLGAISQDPWFSRVASPAAIDHIAIDLDPPDDLPYDRVLDVARWVRDALLTLKATGFAKTSGAGGLHVYVPMPPDTSYDSGLLFAQIVATMVAEAHPKQATIERSLRARGRRVYLDFMQNALGKTLASAYSARASDFAGVSTPLTWDEVEAGVSPRDFSVANFARRLETTGDLWAGLRKGKGADLRALSRVMESRRAIRT
jgi:bifunctional non-homologous end joining protein LigD